MIFDEALRSGAVAPPREPVYGAHAVAASAHPLVSICALDVMRAGGNAVDASLAAAAMLMVVEPRNGHPGGDAFLLVDSGLGGQPIAINGSGAAPAAATLERYRALGEIPSEGLLSSAVPGVVAAWRDAHARFGSRPLAELLDPAIRAAREGIPVTKRLHTLLANDAAVYRRYPSSARVFLPVPPVGATFAQPLLARTLERLVRQGLDDFYTGELARELVEFSRAAGGLFETSDFSEHRTEIRPPVSIVYRGYEIVEQPPVSQGIVVLLTLKILERFELARHDHDSPERIHLLAEALALAYRERLGALGDPRFVEFDSGAFLDDARADDLAAQIDPSRSLGLLVPAQVEPDTTFAAFADARSTVTYIHSLYSGSGVVMGETGVLMNSRLRGFSLDPLSPNVLGPRKRPVHTLNAWLVRKAGETLFAGGTPGAQWQVQTNVQILTNLLDYRMELADAQSVPRFTIGNQLADPDRTLKVESRYGARTFEGLAKRGHQVDAIGPWDAGAAVQLVARDPASGMLRGATEIRRPGCTVLAV
ncbi:MAG: gamma-glutamyltransferase [Candidatus Eremiobacteraeota bacterium]|nr:gamma-glutamyltransferase [Candidatus Eremiobacteraeota bacterium]